MHSLPPHDVEILVGLLCLAVIEWTAQLVMVTRMNRQMTETRWGLAGWSVAGAKIGVAYRRRFPDDPWMPILRDTARVGVILTTFLYAGMRFVWLSQNHFSLW